MEFRIFILSITFESTKKTENPIDSFSINVFNSSLFFSDNFLESLRYLELKSFGRITAEAVTGPAIDPLPASSIPA